MQEAWKDIKEYEGLYQISNLGRVKSLPRFINNNKMYASIGYMTREKILKPHLNSKNGYLYVSLRGNKNKYCSVHRLVAKAFVDNPNNYLYVNHKDENKINNLANNLEWCTKEYNNTYNNKTQRCCKKVIQCDLQGNYIKIWDSARQIAKELNINYRHISRACLGKVKTSNGYIWKFLGKEE